MTRRFALLLVLAQTMIPALAAAQPAVLATLSSGAPSIEVEPPREAEPPREDDPARALASDLAGGRITRGFTRHRVLHFTFDDGPRPSTTGPLLDELDAYGVHATFFVVGRQLEGREHAAQRAMVREIARRGHTVGSHTYDHTNLTTLSDEQITLELTRSEAAIEAVLGGRPWLVRPPYGARDARVDRVLAERGYTEVLWNLTAADTSSHDPDAMVAEFRTALDRQERHPRGPGGVVLLHDTHEWVVEAFPRMMEELRARNCALLETDEELWDVADDLRPFYQSETRAQPHFASTVRRPAHEVAARQIELREQARGYCS